MDDRHRCSGRAEGKLLHLKLSLNAFGEAASGLTCHPRGSASRTTPTIAPKLLPQGNKSYFPIAKTSLPDAWRDSSYPCMAAACSMGKVPAIGTFSQPSMTPRGM